MVPQQGDLVKVLSGDFKGRRGIVIGTKYKYYLGQMRYYVQIKNEELQGFALEEIEVYNAWSSTKSRNI